MDLGVKGVVVNKLRRLSLASDAGKKVIFKRLVRTLPCVIFATILDIFRLIVLRLSLDVRVCICVEYGIPGMGFYSLNTEETEEENKSSVAAGLMTIKEQKVHREMKHFDDKWD